MASLQALYNASKQTACFWVIMESTTRMLLHARPDGTLSTVVGLPSLACGTVLLSGFVVVGLVDRGTAARKARAVRCIDIASPLHRMSCQV